MIFGAASDGSAKGADVELGAFRAIKIFHRYGLWIKTGVVGLAPAAAILLINRRRPYSPWVLARAAANGGLGALHSRRALVLST